jgi:hypothetical protein
MLGYWLARRGADVCAPLIPGPRPVPVSQLSLRSDQPWRPPAPRKMGLVLGLRVWAGQRAKEGVETDRWHLSSRGNPFLAASRPSPPRLRPITLRR